MATIESLLAIVGQPVSSDAVQSLIAAEGLMELAEPDFEEGEPQRFYLANPARGYQLMHRLGRIDTAFVYVQPSEGFQSFPGPLPDGLSPRATRSEIRRQFGTPSRSGAAQTILGLERQGAWDRFDVGSVCLHFQYTEEGDRVRLVSVMTADTAP